ncbi:MAG: PIG-L deacetylase family protein [Pelobium sp.]
MNRLEVENIPIAPEQCVMGFGTTLIIAPHADDESLGCGGVISLLRKYNIPVYILLLTDGTLSHPNSLEYPEEKLRNLRESELLNATKVLNVPDKNVIFCRYKDRSVPRLGDANFINALSDINKIVSIVDPQSIFVPWRNDPHPDHVAAYQLVNNANTQKAKVYEYTIWLNALGEANDFPDTAEVKPFRLDISSVISLKQQAIASHQSQTTDLIDDDPTGFRISAEMLEEFKKPYETFYMSK